MDLNGVPASGNRWLLTDMLRDELGFDGFVVSDANAVRSLETQHFARDLTDAGARAVYAGLDMEMAMFDASYTRLPQAVADGLVDEATIDLAVRRVLTAKFAAGLFEQPFVDEATTAAILDDPAHRDAAQDAAERTAVLLKNDGALPLKAPASIAVLGDLADSQRDILGPWIFDFDLSESVTILDGIRRRAGEGTRVEYAPATACRHARSTRRCSTATSRARCPAPPRASTRTPSWSAPSPWPRSRRSPSWWWGSRRT